MLYYDQLVSLQIKFLKLFYREERHGEKKIPFKNTDFFSFILPLPYFRKDSKWKLAVNCKTNKTNDSTNQPAPTHVPSNNSNR